MWFKNIQLFQMLDPFDYSAEELQHKLEEDAARPCGKIERATYGWTAPMGAMHESLVHAANGCMLIAVRKEEKLLPATVVREHVAERIQNIQQEQDRKVGTREKRALFDEVSIQLLPRAFAKSSMLYAYIDTKNNWLIVDTSSRSKAEELTVLLRKSLGSLKLAPVALKHAPRHLLSDWLLNDDCPSDFTLDDSCDMQDPSAASTVIKCVNQNLYTDEVLAHLKNGKEVIKIAMTWQDRMSFILDEDMAVKRIKFLDLIQEQVKDVHAETVEEQFDADFTIFTAEFAQFLPQLFEIFGGLVDADEIVAEAA